MVAQSFLSLVFEFWRVFFTGLTAETFGQGQVVEQVCGVLFDIGMG